MAFIFTAGLGGAAGSTNITLPFGNGNRIWLSNCGLALGGTSGNINFGGNGVTILDNTKVSFAVVGQSINRASSSLIWRNTATALQGAAVPTTLFLAGGNVSGDFLLEGIDLSVAGSGKTLVGATATVGAITFKDCKFGSQCHSGRDHDGAEPNGERDPL